MVLPVHRIIKRTSLSYAQRDIVLEMFDSLNMITSVDQWLFKVKKNYTLGLTFTLYTIKMSMNPDQNEKHWSQSHIILLRIKVATKFAASLHVLITASFRALTQYLTFCMVYCLLQCF